MHLTLRRTSSSAPGTFGLLLAGGKTLCVTCEEPWLDNRRGVSCIPAGTYRCVKFNGVRFKDVWEVTGVPGRSAILIHAGNTVADTEGCVLVGKSFARDNSDRVIGVTNSRMTLAMLRGELPDEFTLTVEWA